MTPSELTDELNKYGGSNFSINLDTLKEWIFSIEDIGGFILGVIAILLLIGIGFITCLDFIYITIPTARDTYERYINSKIKDTSARLFRIDFVSKDAKDSVLNAYNNNKSPLVYYVKKRFKTYLVATLLLIILITGPNAVIRLIANIIGGILDVLDSLV